MMFVYICAAAPVQCTHDNLIVDCSVLCVPEAYCVIRIYSYVMVGFHILSVVACMQW